MGWNYNIRLDFGNRIEAGQRFLQLVNTILDSQKFVPLMTLTVYEYELYRRKGILDGELETYSDFEKQGLDAKAYAASFSERFRGGNYHISSRWGVNRYYPSEAEIWSAGVEFHVYDEAFDFRYANSATGVIYDAGDYKRYYVSDMRSETAAKNIDLLLKELNVFIDAGVMAFCGPDADESSDRRRWSLVYYRNPMGFLHDLEMMFDDFQFHSALTDVAGEKIIGAAQTCNNIGFITAGQGVVVYSKSGTNGSLREFYHALYEITRR